MKRRTALLFLVIAGSLCETVSAYDIRNIKDNQELATRAGLMVGRYEACNLGTSKIVATLNSKYEWLSKVPASLPLPVGHRTDYQGHCR